MKNIIAIIIIFFRIFILVKVISLLIISRNGFIANSIDNAIWLIMIMIFDIWLMSVLPIPEQDNTEI